MTSGAFVVHRGSLDGNEDLTTSLGLLDGQRLFVVSSNDHEIVLRRDDAAAEKPDWRTAWDALGSLPPLHSSPEWQQRAEERRHTAMSDLERVYADKSLGATDIKRAERELEFADDELAGKPRFEQ